MSLATFGCSGLGRPLVAPCLRLAPWMVLGGSAALAVRLLAGFLLARPSAPPLVPERSPACGCACTCVAAGSEAVWAFLAGLFLGIALVCGVLLISQSFSSGPRAPRRPRPSEEEPRYRPRHAAGRPLA